MRVHVLCVCVLVNRQYVYSKFLCKQRPCMSVGISRCGYVGVYGCRRARLCLCDQPSPPGSPPGTLLLRPPPPLHPTVSVHSPGAVPLSQLRDEPSAFPVCP